MAGGDMAEGRFWVSTGDIRERYDVMNVVASSMRTLVEPSDFAQAAKQLVDNLARAAIALGANGVIWIRMTPVDYDLGFGLYATGTAVRVHEDAAPLTTDNR
jgi:uncharacterized protein YbjQ (UPF0145 family)